MPGRQRGLQSTLTHLKSGLNPDFFVYLPYICKSNNKINKMDNSFSKILLSAGMLSLSALSAFSWGQKGHDTVCFIAENHLTSATKNAVENLLGGKSIVYYSNWLDNASHTPEYAYSKTWHYKNIDDGVPFEKAPLLESGDIVRAIPEQVKILQDPNKSDQDKSLALRMVIHLVGDIHQPMHMGHASDRGGNSWSVKFFNAPSNIHSVWDTKLLEAGHKWSYTEWQQQIDRATEAEHAAIIADGSAEKWGKECHQVATRVYKETEQDSNLSYDYIAKWTPVVEQQLLKGGLRLADLLNSIFDPNYRGSNRIANNQ